MNIVIYQSVVVVPEKGGINRMSNVLSGILSEQGHIVYYLSSERKNRDLLPGQLLLEGESLYEKHSSFDKILDGYQIDLMVYQDGITPSNNYVLRWAKERRIIIIDVIHNSLRGMYGVEGHSFLSRIRPIFLKKAINHLVNLYYKFKYSELYREQFRLSDKIVLLSDKYRKEITWFTRWHDFSKFTAIFNPLTLDRPVSINKDKRNIVLHVALLSQQKRQDLLLDIWKCVEEKRPDWELLIIGDGPLRSKLIKKAEKIHLKRIAFAGFQSPQPYYDEASIFCLTSGYEGFGLVLTEAMAYGCVPMAFDSWDVATDIIDNGVNGYLIHPFDVKAYSEKLITLMDNTQTRYLMAQRAVKKSLSFDIKQTSRLWGDLMKEINLKK